MAKPAAKVYIGAMPIMLCDRFWAIVAAAVNRRIDELMPIPPKRLTTDLSHVTLTKLEKSPMATQDFPATLANDAPFGYEASGVSTKNNNGVQVTDAPTLSSSDDAVGTISFIAPTRYWIQLPDAAPTGSVVVLSGDFDPAQTADNFSFTITIGVDSLTSDVGGVTFIPLTAAPTA